MVFPGLEIVISINANIRTDSFDDFGLLYQDVLRATYEQKNRLEFSKKTIEEEEEGFLDEDYKEM